jgi:tetraacyldisaccharide 4'-kinase
MLNADVKVTKGFADHQDFDQQELETLAQQGSNVIMTEKDAVKCREYAQDNWWYLPVSAQFATSDAERILNRIKEVKATYGSSSA